MNHLRHIFKAILLPSLMLLTTVACERKRTHDIIPEHLMPNVLYDYQLATAVAENDEDISEAAQKEYLYTQAVFRKYGITAQQFELSVAHYARSPKTMMEITEKVCKRYADEIRRGTEDDDNDDTSRKGIRMDTVMIWQTNHDVMLSAAGQNWYEAEIPGKEMKRGARLMVGFNTSWAYREGAKQGYYQVVLTYDNDSIYTQGAEIREYGARQGLSVFLSDHYAVRQAKIIIIQDARWRPFPQILCLNNLRAWTITSETIATGNNEDKKNRRPAATPQGRTHPAKADTLP